MQLLKNPFFLIASHCYLVNRFWLSFLDLPQYKIPYLNDLLCLPVTLTIALSLQQLLFPGSARQRLNLTQVIFTVIYFGVFFEGILPSLASRYTRDWWDLVAYATGGVGFHFYLNPKPKPTIPPVATP
jgi:hypothetical protein